MKSKTFYKCKSNQNLINFQKKNNLSLKYSNSILFAKREELLLLKQKQSKKIAKKKSKIINNLFKSNYISDNLKKNNFSKNQFFTIGNTLQVLTPNISSRNNIKKSFSYTFNKRKTSKLYLTEEALLQNKIIRKSNIKSNINNYKLKTELENIYKEKKESRNSINFLLTIQKDLKEYRERNKERNNIEKKLEKLNKKERSRMEMIKKMKAFNYLKYNSSLNKEREITKHEEKENEIEFIQEKINTLNNSVKFFVMQFINRIYDYLRYLEMTINAENTENLNLMKEKMKIKKEIVQINIDIGKIKHKKEEILNWIYLQIKVKEKRLTLPKYYKTIIEANKAKILYLQTKFDDNLQQVTIKRERDDKLKAQKLKKSFMKKKSNKLDKNIFSPVKKNLYQSEKVIFNSNRKPLNLIFKSPQKTEEHKAIARMKYFLGDENSKSKSKDKEKEFLTKEEFDKIVFWKFRPIYQTPEEFMDSLNYLDLKNIKLLEYYNQLQFNNYCYRQELIKIRNFKDKYAVNIDEQISQKAAELEKIRNKHILILKTHEKINDNKKINKNKKNKEHENKNFSDSDINKIYYKLCEMFDNCKIVNNKELTELIYYHMKSEKTKEGEIIYLIEYIECTLDFLIGKIALYKMDEDLKQKVNKIANQIEKEHRLENPKKQREEERQKNLNLIKKVLKKSEKQYITPRRPIDLIHYNVRELGKPKIKKIINKDDFPNLEDFIQNPIIINDNYSNSNT